MLPMTNWNIPLCLGKWASDLQVGKKGEALVEKELGIYFCEKLN